MTIALYAALAGACALVAFFAGRRLPPARPAPAGIASAIATDEAEEPSGSGHLVFLHLAGLAGMFVSAVAAVDAASLSNGALAVIAVALGAALFAAPRLRQDRTHPTPLQFAGELLVAVAGGWCFYDLVSDTAPGRGWFDLVYPLLGVVGLIWIVHGIVANWNDPDRLEEDFVPSDEGYLPRRGYIPARARAVLSTTLYAIALAFTCYLAALRWLEPVVVP